MRPFGATRAAVSVLPSRARAEDGIKSRLELMAEFPMLLNGNNIISSQITLLVKQLSKKNIRQTGLELNSMINQYGRNSMLTLFKTLISTIDTKSARDQPKMQLLLQLIDGIAYRSNFISLVCQSFEEMEPLPQDFLHRYSKALKCNIIQDLTLGCSLIHSHRPTSKSEGLKFLKFRLVELPSTLKEKLPEPLLHELIQALHNPNFDSKLRENSIKFLQGLYTSINEQMPHILGMLIEDDKTIDFKLTSQKPQDFIESNASLKQVVTSLGPAQVMKELGYACCQDADNLKVLLRQFGRSIDESKVARIIGMMAQTHSNLEEGISLILYDLTLPATSNASTWNLDAFISGIMQMNSKIDWLQTMHQLDYPEFSLKDAEGFALICRIYTKATNSFFFPLHILLSKWNNAPAQFECLKHCLLQPKLIGNFISVDSTQLLSHKSSNDHASKSLSEADKHLIKCFSSVEVVSTLLTLSEDPSLSQKVSELFESSLHKTSQNGALLRGELITKILTPMISGSTDNTISIFSEMWSHCPILMIDALISICNKSPSSMESIIQILDKIGKIMEALELSSYTYFSLELALLASSLQKIDLSQWIESMIESNTEEFAQSLLRFIQQQQNSSESIQAVKLNAESIQSLLKAVKMNESLYRSSETLDLLDQLLPPATSSSLQKAPSTAITSSLVESAANSLFLQFFDRAIPFDNFVQTLISLKTSSEIRNQEVYACMINNLIGEMDFAMDYNKEGRDMLALLAAKVLDSSSLLLERDALTTALSGLKNNLTVPSIVASSSSSAGSPSSNADFGLSVLSHISDATLSQWPEFINSILEIPGFNSSYPSVALRLFRLINTPSNAAKHLHTDSGSSSGNKSSGILTYDPKLLLSMQIPTQNHPVKTTVPKISGTTPAGIRSHSGGNNNNSTSNNNNNYSNNNNPTNNNLGTQRPNRNPSPNPPGGSNNPDGGNNNGGNNDDDKDPKEKDKIEQPDDATKEKIQFILNNVTQVNLAAKAKDLKDILRPNHWDFFAHHLAFHRAPAGQYLTVFVELVETLNEPELINKVLRYSYKAIGSLLSSSKLTTQQERKALNFLGEWIGLWTVARNKPIMFIDLPVKELLLKSYEQGIMYAIVPFVCRIMNQTVHSKVFKVPNPWVVAILRVLKEIHMHQRVRETLRFEVEGLFKNLDEDLSAIPPSEYLQSLRPYSGPNTQDMTPDSSTNWLSGLMISNDLTAFATYPSLKQLTHLAMNRAVDELLREADHSIMIVPTTTVSLVLKDFAAEPDENKLITAARNMAQALAGSLLHATLKNLVRSSASTILKSFLEQQKIPIEPVQVHLQRAIEDNLDTACNAMAKFLIEKTLSEVDAKLKVAIEARRMHRDQVSRNLIPNRPFIDASNYGQASSLPESLRVRPGVGVTPKQMAVYEGFLHLPTLIANAEAEANKMVPATPTTTAGSSPSSSSGPSSTGTSGGAMNAGASGIGGKDVLENKKAIEKLELIVGELERWASTVESNLDSAPDHSNFMPALGRLTMTVLQSQDRVVVATHLASKVFESYFASARKPEPVREMFARILFALARSTPVVVELLTQKYIAINSSESSNLVSSNTAPHPEAWNKDLALGLLNWQLLRVDFLDKFLASELPRNNRAAFDFTMWLVKTSFNSNQVALLSGSDLALTLKELEQIFGNRQRSPNRDSDLAFIQACSQVVLDTSMQTRRAATHTEQLLQQARGRAPTTLRQQQLQHRQAQLGKSLPPIVVNLFSEWVTSLWSQQSSSMPVDKVQNYLRELKNNNLCTFGDPNLRSEIPKETEFIKCITEAAVLAYLLQSYMQSQTQAAVANGEQPTAEQAQFLSVQPYSAIDALSKLFLVLARTYDNSSRTAFVQRILLQIKDALMVDFNSNESEFNQRPYFRLLSSTLINWTEGGFGEVFETYVLSVFSEILTELRPQVCPGFAFAWLELVSHRNFMPKLIRHNRAVFTFHKLILYHLSFMEPLLGGNKLVDATYSLYQGTLRVFLVLLHDFPEFLCDFHQSFCDVLPSNCIQMRNLVLSAFPRNMKLPDPSAPNLKVDQIPASKEAPRVFNIEPPLVEAGIKEKLDAFLLGRSEGSNLLQFLPTVLRYPLDHASKAGQYNVKLMNALILYSGIYAVEDPQRKTAMELFHHLSSTLDSEGKYHMINAFANQLRYPNSHTHYFSWAILQLFLIAPSESIPEQITRVLLERSIAHKPAPWGLLITFQELTKNSAYNFWNRPFVQGPPEIQKLLQHLLRRGFLKQQQQQ